MRRWGARAGAAAVFALLIDGSAIASKPLVFLGDRDLPPYEFVDHGKARGANVDLAVAIGRVLDRPVEVRLRDWSQAQAAFAGGEGDALTMFGRTPDREANFDFSQSTMPVSFALFVRADEISRFGDDSYRGKRIGVTRAGLAREYFQRQYPQASLVIVDSLSDATRRLVRRDIDGFAAQEWSQYYLLSELGTHMIVGLPAFNSRFCNIAMRRGDAALVQDIDRALEQLKSTGELDRIIGAWSHTRVIQVRQSTLDAALAGSVAAIIGLLLLAGFLIVLHRQKKALAQSQRQLEAVDRRKDEFLATLAHELRNPLAPISNAAHVLQIEGKGAPTASWAQGVIVRQVTHLARLVDDLLDVSRVNTGKLELRMEVVELNAVLGDAVDASRPAIEQGRHTLATMLSDHPVWLRADRVRLTQIATNLLNNAAKYMPAGGQIELRTASDPPNAILEVRDEGVGIPHDRLPEIFEMFYQEDRSRGRAQGGLGIGLWLTRRLVQMHGGTVEASSEGHGRGSCFTVRLPSIEAPVAAPPFQPATPAAPEDGRRVLVVDDNRDGAETMAQLLSALGHRVEVALDGEQALRLGSAVKPDIVFLDLGLPGMDGFEVGRRLRASDWGRDVTLVALTGWGGDADKRASREAGFDAHLTKPASAHDLAAFTRAERG